MFDQLKPILQNGERVVVFKNQRWSEADQKKQPLYRVLKSTRKGKD